MPAPEGARVRGGAGRRLLQLREVEAELGVEVGDAADHRSRGVVEHRLAGEVDRGQPLQLELHGADQDLVAGIDRRLGDEVAVDLDAVRRLEIDDPPLVIARIEAGVATGDRGMVENEVVSLGAPDRELSFEIRHPWYAEIDVMDLELFHREALDYSVPAGSV